MLCNAHTCSEHVNSSLCYVTFWQCAGFMWNCIQGSGTLQFVSHVTETTKAYQAFPQLCYFSPACPNLQWTLLAWSNGRTMTIYEFLENKMFGDNQTTLCESAGPCIIVKAQLIKLLMKRQWFSHCQRETALTGDLQEIQNWEQHRSELEEGSPASVLNCPLQVILILTHEGLNSSTLPKKGTNLTLQWGLTYLKIMWEDYFEN